jgi:hypothetical protein
MPAVQAGPLTLLLVQTAASWFMAGLIWTNWIRTAAWSALGVLGLVALALAASLR